MVASGTIPAGTLLLAPVQAFVDWQLFGALPRPGGTFDQPGDLLDDMRHVASVVNRAARRRRERGATGRG